MSFFSYMRTADFWKQIGLIIVAGVLVVTIVMWSLKLFTRHREEIKVTDIRGMKMDQLAPYTEEFGFQFVVRDSVYSPEIEAGTIISQSPLPGSVVKRDRTFYLVVAAALPPSVQMPNLVDLSIRQAASLLETYGLQVGQQIPVPSIAHGAVIRQLYQGEEIEPGTLIRRGELIDLEVGDGGGEQPVIQDSTLVDSLSMDAEYMEEPMLIEESAEPDWAVEER